MAENSFLFRIVSGRGVEVEAQTRAVTVPSPMGQLGFLPDHCDYVGVLGTGIVEYDGVDQSRKPKLVVSDGVITFRQNVLTLLADSVETADTIDRSTYSRDRASLETKRAALDSYDPEWQDAVRGLERIAAIESLLGASK